MTPGARVAAAIDILNDIESGTPAEQALTRWARRSRFAGSKDRAAVRDHVFDLLRMRRTAAHYGGGTDPRALMIGLLRQQNEDLDALFTGDGHAPPPLTAQERAEVAPPEDQAVVWNLPDWLIQPFQDSLGPRAEAAAHALQSRAPLHVRVNLRKASVEVAQEQLQAAGIETVRNPRCPHALTVTEGDRKLRQSTPYLEGIVEIQDASSQAVVETLHKTGRTLDYCAGGGGKALALAMTPDRTVFAHDIDPGRMADLSHRARRAGVSIPQLKTSELAQAGPFDLVLCDVPCSGSGAWRRAPEGKWTLTDARLVDLVDLQDTILDAASSLIAPGGVLAFATCSVLKVENEDRVAAFLKRHSGWQCSLQQRLDIGPDGDGFFVAHFNR